MMGLVLEIEIDILIKKLFDFLFGAFPKENYFSEMSFSVVNIRFHPGGSLINSDFFLFCKNFKRWYENLCKYFRLFKPRP